MKAKQTNLFEYFDTKEARERYGRTTHGGARSKGHRKLARPLVTKKSIHLVLKSHLAKGAYSLLSPKNKPYIESLIKKKALRFGIRIGEFANVGNHLHLKIRTPSRKAFQSFLRSITGQIARHVTKARRGKRFGAFWQGLAFTRVLTSSREELNLSGYIKANQIEALHSKSAREYFLKVFNSWSYRERARVAKLEIYSTA